MKKYFIALPVIASCCTTLRTSNNMNESNPVNGLAILTQNYGESRSLQSNEAYQMACKLLNVKELEFSDCIKRFAELKKQWLSMYAHQAPNFRKLFLNPLFEYFDEKLSYFLLTDLENKESAKALFEELQSRQDIDVNEVNDEGETPLGKAINERNLPAFTELISLPKVDVNQQTSFDMNNAGTTNNDMMAPLSGLVYINCKCECNKETLYSMITMLLNHEKIDLNEEASIGGVRALDFLITISKIDKKQNNENNRSLIKLFLNSPEMEKNINSVNENGNTYAHIAVIYKNQYALDEMIARYGHLIDFTIKNNDGKTPWDIAEENGDLDMLATMKKHIEKYDK